MNLRTIDTTEITLVSEWLGSEENYKWLDFGFGTQLLAPASLKLMTQRDIHLIRVYTHDSADTPIGLVALSNIARNFKTATLWYVLGDKSQVNRGYTTRAVSAILGQGFTEIGLEAVNAWTVDANPPSRQVLERNNFHFIGRQRRCHYVDGQAYDRLWFDLLASEYKAI
ncbi:MAG: GNAT family N-acetyltransferase [Acidobacteria bacterium]|nr:GNAT family N-acetyltransferase [Acidobacteriota bacterium]